MRAAVEAAGGAPREQVRSAADAERLAAKLPPDWLAGIVLVMEELLVRWLRRPRRASRTSGSTSRTSTRRSATATTGSTWTAASVSSLRRIDAGALPTHPPATVLESAGRTILSTVGGASGALYGRGLQRAGAALAAAPGPRGPAADRQRGASQRGPGDRAVDAVAALGRAVPGEKTMLDALVPARVAFAAAVATREPPSPRPPPVPPTPPRPAPGRRSRCSRPRAGPATSGSVPSATWIPARCPARSSCAPWPTSRPKADAGSPGRSARRARRPHESGQCLDDSRPSPVVTFPQRCRRAPCADRAQTVARPEAVAATTTGGTHPSRSRCALPGEPVPGARSPDPRFDRRRGVALRARGALPSIQRERACNSIS